MKALSKKTVNVNKGPAVAKAKVPKPLPDVQVGDVWEDCDYRANGRRVTVEIVTDIKVRCRKSVGGTTMIKRDRFKPTSTGYKLVERDGKAVA